MKNNLYNQGYFKKILGLLIFGIVFFSMTGGVFTDTLSMNDVSTQFNNSTLIDTLNQLGSETIISRVNSADKTLDIYTGDKKVFSFTYNNDYMEYNNRSSL